MTGEYLKEFIRKSKVSQAEIARRIGVSQQSFNHMLSSKDIKSSLVERIANNLHVSIGEIYHEKEQTSVASGNGIAVAGNNNEASDVSTTKIALLEERVKLLQKIIEEKERTIQILMKK